MMRRLALLTALLAGCTSFGGDPNVVGGDDAGPGPADGSVGAEAGPSPQPEDAGADAGSDYASIVLADKPTAYWRMSIASGSVIPDATGNNHSMILGGAGFSLDGPGATTNPKDHAVSFDGITSFAHVPDSAAFDFPGHQEFSIECWIKPAKLADPDSGAPLFHHIFNRSTTKGGHRRGYLAYLQMPNNLLAQRSASVDGGQNDAYAGKSLAYDDKFHHVVVVYKAGPLLSVYVDGQELKSQVSKYDPAESISAEFALAMDLPDDKGHFAGAIDEVAIYDHALDPVRIASHHDAAKAK